MRDVDLPQLRKQAEDAVADMADGELKIKAFEVILGHLLNGSNAGSGATESRPRLKASNKRVSTIPRSCVDRILTLQTEAFFASQRSIGEVRDELARHGWHYPVNNLSGKLQFIVRRRQLRRIKTNDGKRAVWKYSDP